MLRFQSAGSDNLSREHTKVGFANDKSVHNFGSFVTSHRTTWRRTAASGQRTVHLGS